MKIKQYYLFTKKDIFNNYDDNKIYNLMIKGGIIRKLSSGIYIWLPNGLKIINNINKIIKKYMDKLNGIELYIPILQNSTFLKKSNRYNLYGKELFKLYNRYNKLFILSPTNEEIITNIICNEVKNNYYPKFYYQIQNKFRDEIRPRYNILRSIEFIMKEGYSFHNCKKCLNNFYENVLLMYQNIFNYIGIDFFYKEAKCGNIGGILSHEFHINSSYGDNKIYYYKYIKNIINNNNLYFKKSKNKNNLKKIKLFNISKKIYNRNIKDFINVNFFVKSILIKIYTKKYNYFMFILIPYKKKIDINKLYKIFPFIINIKILKKKYINKKFNINSFFICPFGYFYQIIADYSLLNWKNFIFGSNIQNVVCYNVNFFKNINVSGFFDICKNIFFFVKKKISNKKLYKYSSIEIAHTFKLMNYYSNIFVNKNILNKNIFMGCYGIGITRLVFSIIEKYSINNNIVLPLSISHFKIGLIPIDMYNNINVYNISFKIYNFLLFNKINVLFDDRKLYIGKMLTDFEFIGIPNILIISNKMLLLNLIEFKDRLNNNIKYINKYDIFNFLYFKYK